MNKKCVGCGVVLQDQDKDLLGYTPNLNNPYCMRCFRLKNYGEKKEENIIDNTSLIKKINKQEGVVFFLIDFLNINRETINYFKEIKLPKVLIINKCDTLRKDMKYLKIKKYLFQVYNITQDIYFGSGKNNYSNFDLIKYTINHNYKKAYICGITNIGKSTFINNILKKYKIKKEVVVSNKANTTLDFIKFKINNIYLYDTPGLVYNTLIYNLIKPITYKIKEKTTIKILDYYFYFLKDNKVVLYLPDLKVKREYKEYEGNNIKISANEDIIIPGGGFMNIKNDGVIVSNLKNAEVRLDISGVDL